jgi:hypothetical protein
MTANTPESFWGRTRYEDGCLVWTGYRTDLGYGRLGWRGKPEYAHRVAFFLRSGRWPDGILRHLCNNPPCVLHAVEGTRTENELDKVAAGTHQNARKTHCLRGHEFTPENTRTNAKGWRWCRACTRLRDAGMYDELDRLRAIADEMGVAA